MPTEVPSGFRPGTPMPAALLNQPDSNVPTVDTTESPIANSPSKSQRPAATATSVSGSALKAAKARRAPFKVEDTRNGSLCSYSTMTGLVLIRCDQRKGADRTLPPRTDLLLGPQLDIRRAEIAEARNARVEPYSDPNLATRDEMRESFVQLILEAARYQRSLYRWPNRRLQIGTPAPTLALLSAKENVLVTPWSSRSGHIKYPLQPRKDRKSYMLLTPSAIKTLISDVYILLNPSMPISQIANVQQQLAGLNLFQPAVFPTVPRLN